METQQFTTAHVGQRIVGYLIDLVILIVLATIAQYAIGFGLGILLIVLTGDITDEAITAIDALSRPLNIGIFGLYFVTLWAKLGRSLGQMAMGIRIIKKAAPAIGGIGFAAALVRYVGYIVCWFTLGIGFLFGLHDKIAGTDAVTMPRAGSGHSPPLPVPLPQAAPTTAPHSFVTPPTRHSESGMTSSSSATRALGLQAKGTPGADGWADSPADAIAPGEDLWPDLRESESSSQAESGPLGSKSDDPAAVQEVRETLLDDLRNYRRGLARRPHDAEGRAQWVNDHPDLHDYLFWLGTVDGMTARQHCGDDEERVVEQYLSHLFRGR